MPTTRRQTVPGSRCFEISMKKPSKPTRTLQSEDGASIVEYALLLGLIAIVCAAAMALLGNSISGIFSTTASSI